ncbi:low copy number virion structural protein [Priestia megaterium]
MAYTVNHEDIWIESTSLLTWRQRFESAFNYENLTINKPSYSDYQPTRLQFHMSSATVNQTIKVKIKYANRLTKSHLEHAVICQYDSIKKDWIVIPHTINRKQQTLDFTSNAIGVFTVFINYYWYSTFTQRIADEYPNWTKIRQSKESTGQLFLNYFGIELETIHNYLEWIHEQKYIGTADVAALDWIQMYQLPTVASTDELKFLRASGSTMVDVPILESLQEFFYNDFNDGGIVDYQDSKFYTTKSYGRIVVNITRDGVTTTNALTPVDYHIWNTFDEFGLLLGVERLHLENNQSFKDRILDVFRYPSGTHDIGLTNGIARELNMVTRADTAGKALVWTNDAKDLFLKNSSQKKIDIRSLRIDDKQLEDSQYTVDEMGNIRVYALKKGVSHTVSFIAGIEKYQLYEKSNRELYHMMFEEDGQATPTLLKWVEYINTVAPVMWDRFRWDEGFWDTIDKQLTGLGYVPNIWDSDIEVWKDYVFESER